MRLPATRPLRSRPARGFAFALLALAALVPAVLPAAPARAAEPDYSGYQALLQQYIHVLGKKGEPWDSRFDYEQLFIDEKIWQTKRAERLATLHTQLLSVSPATMTPRERTAWALNAYNFLVIEHMTLNLLVPGHRFQRYDSPRQVKGDEGTFFAAPLTQVDGVQHSLTGFELRFVYGDTATNASADGTVPREKGGDPRLQFGLCKAAMCSGLITPWVFRADSLDAQLDRVTRLALALPRWIRLDEATGSFMASNRFFDERADFGGAQMPGLMPMLQKYGPSKLQKTIKKQKLTRPSMFFEPDWKLNQFDHPAPKLPSQAADSTGKH
jgi:hypothetical protein